MKNLGGSWGWRGRETLSIYKFALYIKGNGGKWNNIRELEAGMA